MHCCSATHCHKHNTQLENYYTDIVKCLNKASQQCVPSVKTDFQKEWWCPKLDELKQACIDITTPMDINWPASERLHQCCSERLRCKYRPLRRLHRNMIDRLMMIFTTNTYVKKMKCTNIINGKSGVNNVLRDFTDFYTGVVVQPNTTNVDSLLETDVKQLLTDTDQYNHTVTPRLDICDVERCIRNLKRHKAAGHDNVTSEHLLFGGPHLTVHLTLLFNSMIHHCFAPNDFCNGIILPVLKGKHGDATKVDMHHSTARCANCCKGQTTTHYSS